MLKQQNHIAMRSNAITVTQSGNPHRLPTIKRRAYANTKNQITNTTAGA